MLQAYQSILWKQCHILVHNLGLPPDLEPVVKDLWALRLQLLGNDVESEDVQANTLYSSQQMTAEANDLDQDVRKPFKVKAMPTLVETLGLLYLAMVILRLPVSIGDLHRWAICEDIPYVRAIRFIPSILKQKLAAEYHHVLDTTSTLEPDSVQRIVHRLGMFYMRQFGIAFPALNFHLLLYKHIRELALPSKSDEAYHVYDQVDLSKLRSIPPPAEYVPRSLCALSFQNRKARAKVYVCCQIFL